MVTLALSAVGALGSSALGLGPGVGFAVGSLVGNIIQNRGNSQVIQGPRLRDLTVQDSALGKPIPILYGACRVSGELMWVFNNQVREIELRQTDTVGKGGGTQVTNVEFQYRGDFAIGLGEGVIVGVNRIWFDSTLVYGAVPSDVPDLSPNQDQPREPEFIAGKGNTPAETGVPLLSEDKFRLYRGTETQAVDPLIEEDVGAGNAPPFKGLAYIVFEDIDLTPFGGRIPNVSVEIGAARRRWLGLGFEVPEIPEDDPVVPPENFVGLGSWANTSSLNAYNTPKAVTLDGQHVVGLTTIQRVYDNLNSSIDTIASRTFVGRHDKQDGYLYDFHELTAKNPAQAFMTNSLGLSSAWNSINNESLSTSIWSTSGSPAVQIRDGEGIEPLSDHTAVVGLNNFVYMPVQRRRIVYQDGVIPSGSVSEGLIPEGSPSTTDIALMKIDLESGEFEISEWSNLGTNAGAQRITSNRDSLNEIIYVSSTDTEGGSDYTGTAKVFVYQADSLALLGERDMAGDYGIVMLSPPYPGDGCQVIQSGLAINELGDASNYFIRWQNSVPFVGPMNAVPPNLIHTYITDTYQPTGFKYYRPSEIWFDEYTQAYYAVGAANRGNSEYPFSSGNPERLAYPGATTAATNAREHHLAVGNLYKLDRSFNEVGRLEGIAHERQEGAAYQGSLTRFGKRYIGGDVKGGSNMVVHDVDLETMTLLSSVESAAADADGIGDDTVAVPQQNQFVHSPHKQGAYWWSDDGIAFPEFYGTTGETTLAEIVSDISVRAGLAPTDFDVSELTDIVTGATLPRRDTAANHLVQFMMAYFFDPCEEDWIIKYKKRNRASSANIPLQDLAAGGPGDRNPAMQETIPSESGLPRKINVQTINRWRDYQPDDAQAWRDQSVVITARETTAEMSIVFNGLDEPRGIAQTMLDELYNAHLYEFSVGPKWGTIGPGDVITVNHIGATTSMRTLEVADGADMTTRIRAIKHDQSIYAGLVAGGEGFFIAASLPPLVPAEILLLDVPALRNCDVTNVSLTGFAEANFLAVMGATGSRATATLYRDENPGLTPLLSFSRRSIIGSCVNKLESAPAAIVDTASRLKVRLSNDADGLESVSIQQAIDFRNAALVGSEANGWELITFATAAENADGTWTLSNLTRGGRGTDPWIATHRIGDRFILLDPAKVQRATIDFSEIGVPISYRRRFGGQSINEPVSQNFADNGNRLRPWSPVLINGSRAA